MGDGIDRHLFALYVMIVFPRPPAARITYSPSSIVRLSEEYPLFASLLPHSRLPKSHIAIKTNPLSFLQICGSYYYGGAVQISTKRPIHALASLHLQPPAAAGETQQQAQGWGIALVCVCVWGGGALFQ